MTQKHAVRVLFRSVTAGLVAAMCVVTAARPALAQTQSGEIFGTVKDQSGAVMPGVTVTLTSPSLITPLVAATVESGGYRFPNIPIGIYSVSFELSGFSRLVREGIRIETGFTAQIDAQLTVSQLQETVTVSGNSPVVDTRSTTTGQTFTRDLLERIPSARDPWVMMEQTPGIVMTQQNVGGNKSGQQSTFTAHGTANNEVWNIDGGNITDMAASSSSLYFDFDAFEEIQIQTGGSDASVQSSGVSINLITKSGGNTFKGSSRIYVVDNNLQGDNVSPELKAQGAGSGNPIKNIRDYGFELGGPIKHNKAWFWGSAGYQDIQVGVVGFTVPGGNPNNPEDLFTDLTKLKTYNAKVQFQWTPAHKSVALYNFNDKIRNARGAGPLNPPETTFRQTAPVSTYKVSQQWIAGRRLSLEAQAMSMPDGGFRLDFNRDELIDVQSSLDLGTQMTGRSNQLNDNRRPQKEIRIDGNYFLTSLLGGDHSTKFGGGWRDTPFGFTAIRGGHARARFRNGAPIEADLYRDSNTETALSQVFGYVQDAYKRGRFTLSGGLRFDYQDDEALPSHVSANPLIPELLPAVDFAGADSGVTFMDWSPRVGVTYALGGGARTVVKGNYAIYYGTGISTASSLNPVSEVSLRFPWTDRNLDQFVQRDELDLRRVLNVTGNYDQANPASPRSSTRVDSDLQNDRTDEFTIGIEREVGRDFGVSATYIFRNLAYYQNFTRVDNVRSADYLPVAFTAPCGNVSCDRPSYTVTYYELPFQQPGTGVLVNAQRTRRYHGLELTARKRFSRRWLLSASGNVQSTTYHYAGPDVSYQDPTDIEKLDGAQTGNQNARWIGKISGLYVLPWRDIGVSAFLNMRQGYPNNRTLQSPSRRGGIGTVNADIDRFGDARFENFYQLDMRVEKQVRLLRTDWAVSLDVFNALNADTVLNRQSILNSTTANNVTEVLAARVARLGVRLKF